jgi:hypothetical protein
MGAATPLRYNAHIRSPANRINLNPKSRLRRKQESNCGILEKRTPAQGKQTAGEGIGDIESLAAHKQVDSTFRCFEAIPWPRKTPTERTAGAIACVVSTGNKLASHCNYTTTVRRNAIVSAYVTHSETTSFLILVVLLLHCCNLGVGKAGTEFVNLPRPFLRF